jgi:hypothetical protein
MVRGTRSAYFPVLNETGVSDVPRLASAPMSRAPPFLPQSVAGNQRSTQCESDNASPASALFVLDNPRLAVSSHYDATMSPERRPPTVDDEFLT